MKRGDIVVMVAPGERPYAGWLYGAWERTGATERTRSRLRVEAGVTGPPSLAVLSSSRKPKMGCEFPPRS